jgi:hypothetical protein
MRNNAARNSALEETEAAEFDAGAALINAFLDWVLLVGLGLLVGFLFIPVVMPW